MSTRANVIIKSGNEKLFFYRHSDGYPEGTLPALNIFIKWLKEGKIRDNVGQSAGWLIIIGALEYAEYNPMLTIQNEDISTIGMPKNWKVGAFEPTTDIHGDIDYLYVIDLVKKEVKCYDEWTDAGEGTKEVKLK